jgi:flavin reductase (DIM6/NTAB) family NADH-FMN oxidoreductase RutF
MVPVTGRDIAALLNPRPAVLVTCCDSTGIPNVMSAAWHTPISHEPPIVGISIGATRHSYKLIEQTHEFVLNIVGAAFEEAVRLCGNCSGANGNKFVQAGLRVENSHKVRSPRIAGALAYLECQVIHQLPLGDHALFVAYVACAEARDECFSGMWHEALGDVLLCRQRDEFGRCEPLPSSVSLGGR